MKYNIFPLLLLAVLLASCRPSVPTQSTALDRTPVIMPDYVDVTVPVNICPLNFGLSEPGKQVVARLSTPSLSFVYGNGKQVEIDAQEWEQLKQSAVGSHINVELWAKQPEGWVAYQPFSIHVAPDSIDRYLSYRLIPPSYVGYEELIIEQRDLSSFQTQEIYNNMKVSTETKGQCINCHSYQDYNRSGRFLFHARQAWGGTVLVDGEKIRKVDLKRPETLSAGVYPAWHPTLNLIAFSTNKTAQIFHTTNSAKVEVFDAASDLICYDVEQDQVSHISNLGDQLESFPTWSPDGRWLYFCSARIPFDTLAEDTKREAILHYQEVRYDLYRKSFDPGTHTFGPSELVYCASADSLSVTLPRISPDGRWLVAAVGPFGCFHVWHPEADIMLFDLQQMAVADTASFAGPAEPSGNAGLSGTAGPSGLSGPSELTGTTTPTVLHALNSNRSESYPSFSSNGRWLMCASRRDDGNYTRPYIAYFDREGQCHKPFEVPQLSPAFYQLSFKSFNRPEFMAAPVQVTPNDIARTMLAD